MGNATPRRRLLALATTCALALLPATAANAATTHAAPAHHPCPTGEIFATNNTATITDPADPRLQTHLRRFDHEVRATIRANGAHPGASTLLNGVFWSSDLNQTTYERSREFDVTSVGPAGLHHIAAVIAKQYHQEAVLTFRCLPTTAPDTDAVEIQAPGLTVTHLHDALLADPEARATLEGGSVTLDGHLILITPLANLAPAQKFAKSLGVDWNTAEVRYGADEFVS